MLFPINTEVESENINQWTVFYLLVALKIEIKIKRYQYVIIQIKDRFKQR